MPLQNETLAPLMALSLGDVVEAPSIFCGLTNEATILQVVKVEPKVVTFRVSYFGAFIATKKLAQNKKGEFSWT